MLLEIVGSLGVAGADTQLLAAQLLEMSGLGVDEKLIDRWYADVIDQAQVDSHAHFAEVVHGFLAADFLRGF